MSATDTIAAEGHLIDSGLLSAIFDKIIEFKGAYEIVHFDIGRTIPRELRLIWFGAGPHFCLGYNLAMRELTTVMTALLDGAPELEIVSRKAARKVLLPTWDELWVRRKGGPA